MKSNNIYRWHNFVLPADKLNVDIHSTIKKYENQIDRWAYILHIDNYCKPHYHICVAFSNSCDFEYDLHCPGKILTSCSEVELLKYLLHKSDIVRPDPFERQYSIFDIHTNIDITDFIG